MITLPLNFLSGLAGDRKAAQDSQPLVMDGQFLFIIAALSSIGLVMIASSSVSYAEFQFGDKMFFLKRHLLYLCIGISCAAVVLKIPTQFWHDYGLWLLAAAFLVLIVVLIPGIGRRVNGSQRWIGLGPLTLQGSELAKLAFILFLAGYLHRHQHQLRESKRELFKPLGLLLGLCLLLILEPDFGSTAVLVATSMAMLFFAGVKLWQFSLLMLTGVGGLALLAVLSPYRIQRLVTYLDPWADQFNSGYQLTQSLIAFGRGEWLGVGLGNSVQKLFYLPEAHTDFVFAIFAEEFGLLGVLLVIALFVALLWKIFAVVRMSIKQQYWFGAYSCFGIGVMLAGQAFINIGVTSGLLPTKGLTLPFISYGGSSLVVCCVMAAFIMRVDMEQKSSVKM